MRGMLFDVSPADPLTYAAVLLIFAVAACAALVAVPWRRLILGRWRISLVLTGLLFILYYGYILLIATNRQLVSRPLWGVTTAGIVMAAVVIVGAWMLTAAYVIWANRHYDPAVARLRARAEGK